MNNNSTIDKLVICNGHRRFEVCRKYMTDLLSRLLPSSIISIVDKANEYSIERYGVARFDYHAIARSMFLRSDNWSKYSPPAKRINPKETFAAGLLKRYQKINCQ